MNWYTDYIKSYIIATTPGNSPTMVKDESEFVERMDGVLPEHIKTALQEIARFIENEGDDYTWVESEHTALRGEGE